MTEQNVAPSGSNFYYSFLLLPAKQRAAIIAIYAFCREVDDIVDECSDQNVAAQKINWWHSEIDRIYAGQPQHPLSKALMPVIQEYNLPKIWFSEILQGMSMDLRYQGYQTFEDLRVYCHCVASTVGMLAASVFGYKNANTLEYAKKLGLAFQLINIIRDVGEDARRGRVYIAEADLQAHGIDPTEILQLNPAAQPKLSALLNQYATRAREYYTAALAELTLEDRTNQRSGLIMANIYFNILSEIERSNFAVLNQKISLTPLRKLWITWRTWRNEKNLCQQLS
jgi:phytoene synthase